MRALGDFDRLETDRLVRSDLNPLTLAMNALDAGDMGLAADHWENARNRIPDHILGSEVSIRVLLELKRFDELEALMLLGHKKRPREVLYKQGLAQVAEKRGRFAEAAKWWSSIRIGSSNKIDLWLREASCLERSDQMVASADVLHLAARHFPDRSDVWAASARADELIQRWPEALQAWDYLAETLKDAGGYAGAARAHIAMGDPEGAAQRLRLGSAKFPYHFDILKTTAELSEKQGDLPQAIKMWEVLRMAHPQLETGYREGIRCLQIAGEIAQAKQLFELAEARFPGKLTYYQ